MKTHNVLRNSRVLAECEVECEVLRRMNEVAWLMSWDGQDERLWNNGPGSCFGAPEFNFSAQVSHSWSRGAGQGIETIVLGHKNSIKGKLNSAAMQETWVQSLGQEDPLKKEMATHSSILA